ncbi:MAG: hypothetical protein HY665_02195 [Chloroflexi bacterium]|nr:hypothetical protein [Chloroflexota bacterium]
MMSKVRKTLLAASSLVMVILLVVSCGEKPEPRPSPAPVSGVLPGEHPTDFPENLRPLTDEEKAKLIRIALDTPSALEWRQKESQYKTDIGWIALYPSSSGKDYSGYRKFEYGIVEKGIPRGTIDVTPPGSPERIVSVGVPENAEIYPNVTILFGTKWIVSVAIDLKTGKVVFDEDYPFRTGPTPPK